MGTYNNKKSEKHSEQDVRQDRREKSQGMDAQILDLIYLRLRLVTNQTLTFSFYTYREQQDGMIWY